MAKFRVSHTAFPVTLPKLKRTRSLSLYRTRRIGQNIVGIALIANSKADFAQFAEIMRVIESPCIAVLAIHRQPDRPLLRRQAGTEQCLPQPPALMARLDVERGQLSLHRAFDGVGAIAVHKDKPVDSVAILRHEETMIGVVDPIVKALGRETGQRIIGEMRIDAMANICGEPNLQRQCCKAGRIRVGRSAQRGCVQLPHSCNRAT